MGGRSTATFAPNYQDDVRIDIHEIQIIVPINTETASITEK
jgi:hypothetical protein